MEQIIARTPFLMHLWTFKHKNIFKIILAFFAVLRRKLPFDRVYKTFFSNSMSLIFCILNCSKQQK